MGNFVKKHVYIAACSPDGGIYHYTTDGKTLQFCEKTLLDRPMYLVISENRLYAIMRQLPGRSNESGILSYPIEEDGRLGSPSEPQSTHGVVACHLCVREGTVYTVNYLSGNVVKLPNTISTHCGKGVHPTRQTEPHTHFICTSPDGKYLLNTDLGLDTIFVCDPDLNPVAEAKVPAGSGCRHLVFSADGTLLYCANELGNTVSVFRYQDGQLTYRNSYAALPSYYYDRSTIAAIRLQGEYLYVSNRTHDSITCFRCVGETLELVSITPCGGKSPRDFDLNGNLMVVTNEASDSVTLFRAEGGTLIPLEQTLSLSAPLSVIFKD